MDKERHAVTRPSGIDFRNLAPRGCPWQTASEEQGERTNERRGTSRPDARAARSCSSQFGACGSGVSSRARLSILVFALLVFALLALAPFSQAKVPVNGFGILGPPATQGALGGEFGNVFVGTARGVAVNSSGVGAAKGTTYIADGNRRVQRFGPTGAFQRAWGQDVIATSVNEQQKILVNATAGTYSLTFQGFTTQPIAFNVGNTELEKALNSLPSINSVTVGQDLALPNILIVTFTGTLAATNVQQLSADTGQLAGSVAISTLTNGANSAVTGGSSTGFEICTFAEYCKAGSTSGTSSNGGQLNSPEGVAVNQANGHLYVTESQNRRVSEFAPDGNFVRAWGWDVIKTGGSGDVSANAFEVCTVAADCTQGASGANGGEFGTTLGYPVVDSSGNLWIPDAANRRIQEFDSTGNFIAAYGYNVDALGGGGALEKCTSTDAGACQAGTTGSGAGQFSSNNPKDLAFDSSGNLYAIDSGNNRVQKFDPALTTATTFGAATFAAFATAAPEHLVAAQGGERLVFSLNNNVTAVPSERQLVELDPTDASVKDTSLVGIGLNNVSGLAAEDATGTVYATTTSKTSPNVVFALGSLPPAPALTMNAITVKGETTATFSALVDPKGAWVGCNFQYSTDQNTWTDIAAPDCGTLAAADGSQLIGQEISNLSPNTQYYVRLQASRPLVSNSTVSSNVRVFKTDSVPPVVSDIDAIQISDTSARLVGTIDPRNADTGYVFQYGTTPVLGSSTAPLDIGGGTTPITVSQVVGGLAKDTTYHFRLAATNATGTTASASKTLHTRVSPLPLPDARRYEMVSPPDKNLGSVDRTPVDSYWNISTDGNSVGFCTYSLFGDLPPQMTLFCGPYLSQRDVAGWTTKNPIPSYCRYDLNGDNSAGYAEIALSADHSRAAMLLPEFESCDRPPLVPGAFTPGRNLYKESLNGNPDYALMTPLKPWVVGLEPLVSSGYPVGGSEDFSHVVYTIHSNQTSTPDSPLANDLNKVYQWMQQGEDGCAAPEGCVTLVSKDTSNVAFATASNYPEIFEGNNQPNRAVSADGERIYFQNPVGGSPVGIDTGQCLADCELYMRKNAAETIDVSASECTLGPATCGTPGNSADFFKWATPSGEKAFFYSCAKLTDESAPAVNCGNQSGVGHHAGGTPGSKLYRWDENAPPGHHLVDISLDHEPADGVQAAPGNDPTAGELVMIGSSDDGNTVFFASRGQLVSGAPLETDGAKIHRWRWNGGSPSLDYLGAFNPIRGYSEKSEAAKAGTLTQRWVSPDGKYLEVETTARLVPAVDRDSDRDVYRWDEANGWQCASCQLPGVPSAGDSVILTTYQGTVHNAFLGAQLYGGALKVSMTDDGRIFFDTPDALVPEDVNGEVGCTSNGKTDDDIEYSCQDVYEWNEGTVSLVSSGTSNEPSRLLGTDPSGRDVFFYTRQRLVGWDIDSGVDIYDARVGGGFPEPPPQPPTCEGEACRGAGTTAAATTGAGTAAFQGPGNPAPKHRKAHKPRKHKKHHKRARDKQANQNRRAGR
jgi:hypothetical protein